nr:MAG TPA: head closure knob [Caudoviricetes sp.]
MNLIQHNTILSNTTGLPNMAQTIQGWFQPVEFEVITRSLADDGDGVDWVSETVTLIKTQGVVRPPSDKDLKILPEGTWAWEWLQIHCLPNVELNTNQFVIYKEKRYKVMAKKDWTEYGYIRYTLLEAFQAEQLEGGVSG